MRGGDLNFVETWVYNERIQPIFTNYFLIYFSFVLLSIMLKEYCLFPSIILTFYMCKSKFHNQELVPLWMITDYKLRSLWQNHTAFALSFSGSFVQIPSTNGIPEHDRVSKKKKDQSQRRIVYHPIICIHISEYPLRHNQSV